MIRSFGDRKTKRLFADQEVREFQGIARRAKRWLEAVRLADLRVRPSNRLEKLKETLPLDPDQRPVADHLSLE